MAFYLLAIIKLFTITSLCLLLIGCGRNSFAEYDQHDPAELATVALEEQKPDKAIKILDAALKDDPSNYTYLSLLAEAKAQKAGIDIMEMAIDLVISQAENAGDGESQNSIVSMFGIMPEPNEENIALLEEAISTMEQIPAEERLSSDQFKLTMFYTSVMTLRTKTVDLDGDGKLSAEELAAMDESTALAIITDLANAEGNIQGYSAEDGTQKATEKISGFSSSINSQPGSNDTEKLRSFLAS